MCNYVLFLKTANKWVFICTFNMIKIALNSSMLHFIYILSKLCRNTSTLYANSSKKYSFQIVIGQSSCNNPPAVAQVQGCLGSCPPCGDSGTGFSPDDLQDHNLRGRVQWETHGPGLEDAYFCPSCLLATRTRPAQQEGGLCAQEGDEAGSGIT